MLGDGWRLDPSQPIYEQIWRAVAGAVVRGELAAGEALPSVRDLAMRLGVNVNTVQKAYRALETADLVRSRPGQGTFVHADAHAVTRLRERQIEGSVARLVEDLGTWGVPAERAASVVARYAAGMERVGGGTHEG